MRHLSYSVLGLSSFLLLIMNYCIRPVLGHPTTVIDASECILIAILIFVTMLVLSRQLSTKEARKAETGNIPNLLISYMTFLFVGVGAFCALDILNPQRLGNINYWRPLLVCVLNLPIAALWRYFAARRLSHKNA